MKISKSTVEQIRISGLDELDPITVIVEDYNQGQGKIIISSWDGCWNFYWGAMGERNIKEFIVGCHNDYLCRKFLSGETRETDYDQIESDCGIEETLCTENLILYEKELQAHYGQDWIMDLPKKHTSDYFWLCKILDVVKNAFKEDLAKAA